MVIIRLCRKERTIDMKKRGFSIAIGCFVLIGAVSWVLGAFPEKTPTDRFEKSQENDMHIAYKTETEAVKIPPIDAASPSVFETASFGLG
jgi:hypothetical protein